MKAWIRNKKTGEVLEAALNITPSSDWELSYDKPATEPCWRDVTGECSIADSGNVWQGILHHAKWIGYEPDNYRLRKVQWTEPYDHGVGAIAYRHAFIVERKVE